MEIDRVVEEALVAAAEADPGVLEVARNADGTFTVAWGEDDAVVVATDPMDARVVLSAGAGTPSPERAAGVHAMLLAYNLAWRETGSVRCGVAGPDGEVVVMVDLFGPLVDAANLGALLRGLRAKARLVAELVAGGFDDAAAAPGSHEMMRV